MKCKEHGLTLGPTPGQGRGHGLMLGPTPGQPGPGARTGTHAHAQPRRASPARIARGLTQTG